MTLPTIFPPSSLPAFLAEGHGIELGNDYAPVPRGRGHSRLRPKSSGAPRIVSVVWRLTDAQAYDFDFWIEYSLDRATRHFAAKVANQGPGQLYWDAVWLSPPRCEPQAIGGHKLLWTVTGRILLSGAGEAALPMTGALSAEIDVPLLGSATIVLPDTPLAAEITVALLPITALRAEITVPLLPLRTPLACEILVPLDGSATISSGGGGDGSSYSLTVEDDGTSIVDPAKLIFPTGTVEQDSDGNAVVTFSSAGNFYFQSAAPSSPTPGWRWIDSDTGILYTWVDDGTSTQWVEF